MKKGLSLFLAASLAVSSFSTAALAAEDLTAEEKYQALVEAGIFEGFPDGQAHLDQNMTRAQAAKIITLVLGLNENPAAASVYNDLEGAEWAAGYIGAATAAGILEGRGNGVFDPSADVSIQELAKIMVELLDLEVDEDATVEGADEWAQKYVAAAVEAGLIPESSNYTVPATRELLVEASYTAYDILNVPALAAIEEAKAIGVQKVEVQLNKAVDTSKATLTLKKGTTTVATTTEWAEDGTSAVLKLNDVKISAGEYTVTLGGVEEVDEEAAVASFTAEDEKVVKLEFLTASDTIAYATDVLVKAAALNQYGEPASINAGSYEVHTSGATDKRITKDDDGTIIITLDTKTNANLQPNISIIPVTLVNTQNYMSVTKNFKLGNEPILSKLELGEARYSVGNALTDKGQKVTFDLNFYDQYGNVIAWDLYDREYDENTNVIWNTYVEEDTLNWDIVENGREIPELEINLLKNLDKTGDYSFTVFNQAANATGTISVQSAKVATKIQIGDVNDVIAAGDKDVYIPIIAYDAQGNQLSKEDLADDANRLDRIQITVSGAKPGSTHNGKAVLEASGPHKGELKLSQIEANYNGAVSVSVVIATANATSTDTRTFTVQKVRAADRLKEVKAPAEQIVRGGDFKFEFNVMDSYGKELKKSKNASSTGSLLSSSSTDNPATPEDERYDGKGTNNAVSYFVGIKATGGTGFTVTDNAGRTIGATETYYANGSFNGKYGPNTSGTGSAVADFEDFNKEFKVVADATASGTLKIEATLYKLESDSSGAVEKVTPISKVTRNVEVATADQDLTYSVEPLRTLFAALDTKAVTEATYAAAKDPAVSPLAAEVKVTAKNAAGDTVALPKVVKQITTSNPQVAQVKLDGNKGFVIGNKPGEATINVVYETVKGETKQISLPVTVKSDPITIEKIVAEEDDATYVPGKAIAELLKIDVTDNYGAVYEWDNNNEVANYNFLLGLVYSIERKTGNLVVSVDDKGNINYTSGSGSIDVQVTAPNGKSITGTIYFP